MIHALHFVTKQILLKCYLESTEDVSVVDVPSTLTYTQLKEGIKNKYGRDLRVSFKVDAQYLTRPTILMVRIWKVI